MDRDTTFRIFLKKGYIKDLLENYDKLDKLYGELGCVQESVGSNISKISYIDVIPTSSDGLLNEIDLKDDKYGFIEKIVKFEPEIKKSRIGLDDAMEVSKTTLNEHGGETKSDRLGDNIKKLIRKTSKYAAL